MMTNLIDLHEHGHNQGHSLNDSLQFRFGAELTPTKVPPHRNLIKIIHHYSGTTFNFQKFHHLVAPPGLQGIEMAHQTLFFVMPEYPKSLKTFMENTSFNSSLEKFLLQQLYQLLSAIYLLEKMHIVHRDIKPDNIFLDCRLRPILADFGFAKKLRNLDMKIPVTHLGQIEAANNLAWTPEMIRWKTTVYPFTNVSVLASLKNQISVIELLLLFDLTLILCISGFVCWIYFVAYFLFLIFSVLGLFYLF